jgi:hypothetical protein
MVLGADFAISGLIGKPSPTVPYVLLLRRCRAMLKRWREYRLENAEASLHDWRGELVTAKRFGHSNGSRGVECRRVIARLERRIARLQSKLGMEVQGDGE